MSLRSSRAVSVMKTLLASESAHAMIERARAMPASTSTVSSAASPSMKVAMPSACGELAVLGSASIDYEAAPARRCRSRTTWRPTRPKPQTMWWSVSESIIFCVRRGTSRSARCPATNNSATRRKRVEERTDAQHHERDLHDLAGGAARLRKAADGRRAVERPAKRVPEADFLAQAEAERAEC